MAIATDTNSSAAGGTTGKQKVALLLKRAGYSDAEIAAELGISRENANRLLQRGRKRARAFLREVSELLEDGGRG